MSSVLQVPSIGAMTEKVAECRTLVTSTRAELALARRRFQADQVEAVLQDRKPDAKLRKAVADLVEQESLLEEKERSLTQAIQFVRDQDIALKDEREYARIQAFWKKAAPEKTRLTAAFTELRDAAQAFFALTIEEQVRLDGYLLADYLVPLKKPKEYSVEHELRALKVSLLNTAIQWLALEQGYGAQRME